MPPHQKEQVDSNPYLQLFQLFDKLRTQHIHSGAELLTNLDEGRAQLDKPFSHPDCQFGFPISNPIRRHALQGRQSMSAETANFV